MKHQAPIPPHSESLEKVISGNFFAELSYRLCLHAKESTEIDNFLVQNALEAQQRVEQFKSSHSKATQDCSRGF
jgi:hypothetical protein